MRTRTHVAGKMIVALEEALELLTEHRKHMKGKAKVKSKKQNTKGVGLG